MSLHPWTIGEQTLTIIPPRPPNMPDDKEWLGVQLTFSHDPNDSSTKRLRVVPPNPNEPAAEVTMTGNGTIVDTIFQPRDRRPWDRKLPAVVMVDGSWCYDGPVAKDEKPKPLTAEQLADYDRLATIYHQPTLADVPNALLPAGAKRARTQQQALSDEIRTGDGLTDAEKLTGLQPRNEAEPDDDASKEGKGRAKGLPKDGKPGK